MADGKAKFNEARQKLHAEDAQKEEAAIETKKAAITQLAKLQENKTLADLYAENSQLGAENLSQELPLLKIHSAGRSTKNQMADGSKPTDGWFFYKPTAEQFEEVVCHILTISRGYRAEGLNPGEEKFQQILAGIMVDTHKPFLLFFSGKRLGNLWDFGKEASQYTKAKPVPIPMFALTVKLKTRSEANKYGESWVVDFQIMRETNAQPLLVLDEGEFVFLKDQVDMITGTVEQLIASKAKEETAEAQPTGVRAKDPNIAAAEADADREDIVEGEEVSTEDIPF